MKKRLRPLSPSELKNRYEHIYFFEFKRRRLAREEAASGMVEVLEFAVDRAWFESLCGGKGCCPNSWFLKTGSAFVHINSWEYFAIANPRFSERKYCPLLGGEFPGRIVTIERWPRSGRIISASVHGQPVPIELNVPNQLSNLAGIWNQCVVYERSELNSELLRALADGEA